MRHPSLPPSLDSRIVPFDVPAPGSAQAWYSLPSGPVAIAHQLARQWGG